MVSEPAVAIYDACILYLSHKFDAVLPQAFQQFDFGPMGDTALQRLIADAGSYRPAWAQDIFSNDH